MSTRPSGRARRAAAGRWTLEVMRSTQGRARMPRRRAPLDSARPRRSTITCIFRATNRAPGRWRASRTHIGVPAARRDAPGRPLEAPKESGHAPFLAWLISSIDFFRPAFVSKGFGNDFAFASYDFIDVDLGGGDRTCAGEEAGGDRGRSASGA